MRAKELFFDFLETIFFICCILFFFFYLFLGDHLDVAKKIFQTAGVLSIFGIFFIIRWKLYREQIRKKDKEGQTGDIVAYLQKKDVLQDRIFIFLISFFLVFVAFLMKSINSFDFIQSLTVITYMNVFHLIIFTKKENLSSIIALTEVDEIKDRVAILLLSLLLLVETLFSGGADLIDFLQIAVVYISFYLWHKHIFKS